MAALHSKAGAAFGLGCYTEAKEAFFQVVKRESSHLLAWAGLWRAAIAECDWRTAREAAVALQAASDRGQIVLPPFDVLAFADDPLFQRQCAEVFVDKQMRRESLIEPQGRQAAQARPSEKIRLAYLSADFHEHATAYLMAEMFERHDRGQFEVIAISFGPDDVSPMRHRLQKAFDQFWDVQGCTHTEVVQRMWDAQIDIAVDLKGFTRDSRTSILLRKPAPVVVNFLGYPGTMGTPIYDYLIGDAVVTPAGHEPFFSEQLVQMPSSYQVNDTQRTIGDTVSSRESLGLPANGVVFGAFNAIYKITPEFFRTWMRLLKAVSGSVLWLITEDPSVRSNLRKEAEADGVEPARLVFATRVSVAQHLARHRYVDILLDNLPVNAHTTTSDALWAGVPVVTCMGQAFAGRVAASLLHAVGLPELVTHSLPEYEALALRLATQPQELQRLRAHLQAVRSTAPLFNTERFTRQLESAYVHMHKRRLQGLPPRGLCRARHAWRWHGAVTLGSSFTPTRRAAFVMNVIRTAIPEVIILEPKVFGDSRGFFFESFNQKVFNEVTDIRHEFVQDNHSRSAKGVLRGLHYQIQQPQGKLVRVVSGSVFDVAVDIRRSSPTFGRWVGAELSADNHHQLWVPPGFAHGFVVLSESAEFLYKTTDYYAPAYERCIAWNDPTLAIDWRLAAAPLLSAKDAQGLALAQAEVFP